MSSPARYQPIASPAVARTEISQATAVEQSRAVAEVQAAVYVAQQNRRNKALALTEMRESTAQKFVAERAFFKFPRGGQSVSGPSIHLARELARCWGNINFGVTELRRDDVKGESEMQAYAWDLETNARNATTFIVPHKRDTKSGTVQLTDMRDIYENSANQGARRLRETIFAVLPDWFIEEAAENCRKTLNDGGGVPLPQRIANSIAAYESIGVVRAQLEAKVGRPSAEWTDHDVSELGISFNSIKKGEISRDQEFPPVRLSAAEITSNQGAKPEPAQVEEPDAEPGPAEPSPAAAKTKRQQQAKPSSRLCGQLRHALIAAKIEQGETVTFLSGRVGREVTGPEAMTIDEINATIEFLRSGEEPVAEQPAEQLPIDGGDQ